MIKITENKGKGLEAQEKGEGNSLDEKICHIEQERNNFSLFNRKEKNIPQDIEKLLLENSFTRVELYYCNDLYVRKYNNTVEVFSYYLKDIEGEKEEEIILTRVPKWDMRTAGIFKRDVVRHAIAKIKGYSDGKETPLFYKLLTPAIWTGCVLGPIFAVVNALLMKETGNYYNIWPILGGFAEGGIVGATLWRGYWYLHNRRFKEGKEAINYIQNGRLTQLVQEEAEAIPQAIQSYSLNSSV
jgi:hypothetical protein